MGIRHDIARTAKARLRAGVPKADIAAEFARLGYPEDLYASVLRLYPEASRVQRQHRTNRWLVAAVLAGGALAWLGLAARAWSGDEPAAVRASLAFEAGIVLAMHVLAAFMAAEMTRLGYAITAGLGTYGLGRAAAVSVLVAFGGGPLEKLALALEAVLAMAVVGLAAYQWAKMHVLAAPEDAPASSD